MRKKGEDIREVNKPPNLPGADTGSVGPRSASESLLGISGSPHPRSAAASVAWRGGLGTARREASGARETDRTCRKLCGGLFLCFTAPLAHHPEENSAEEPPSFCPTRLSLTSGLRGGCRFSETGGEWGEGTNPGFGGVISVGGNEKNLGREDLLIPMATWMSKNHFEGSQFPRMV